MNFISYLIETRQYKDAATIITHIANNDKKMNSLKEIWQQLKDSGKGSDKGDVHSYIDVYNNILAPYRDTAKNVLEIGVFKGHSLLMWEQYFTNATVHGIDCDEQPVGGMADLRPLIAEGHQIHIFDACDKVQIHERFKDIKFDVIVDDAQHEISQQLALYAAWKPYLAPGAIYIIEDVQNIDADREKFLSLDSEKSIEVIDLRSVKGRYDDVIIVIK